MYFVCVTPKVRTDIIPQRNIIVAFLLFGRPLLFGSINLSQKIYARFGLSHLMRANKFLAAKYNPAATMQTLGIITQNILDLRDVNDSIRACHTPPFPEPVLSTVGAEYL